MLVYTRRNSEDSEATEDVVSFFDCLENQQGRNSLNFLSKFVSNFGPYNLEIKMTKGSF